MFRYSICIIILVSICMNAAKEYFREKGSYTHTKRDFINRATKVKMINVSTALVKDAMLKLRQIAAIRDNHSDKEGFGVGMVLGNIREKYRRMLETYREVRDKYTDRSVFTPPAVYGMTTSLFLLAMEHVHMLEVDIDKLVHILESMHQKQLNVDPRLWTTSRRPRTRSVRILREMLQEQEYKSGLREKLLMRRFKMAGEHTTKKRFDSQWPVEESWRVGIYGDMGVYGAD